MEHYRSLLRRDLEVIPTGNFRRALAPRDSAQSAMSRRGKDFRNLRCGITPGEVGFLPHAYVVVDI